MGALGEQSRVKRSCWDRILRRISGDSRKARNLKFPQINLRTKDSV